MSDLEKQINELEVYIEELKEYLYSDCCVFCGQVAVKLENCLRLLKELKDKL